MDPRGSMITFGSPQNNLEDLWQPQSMNCVLLFIPVILGFGYCSSSSSSSTTTTIASSSILVLLLVLSLLILLRFKISGCVSLCD